MIRMYFVVKNIVHHFFCSKVGLGQLHYQGGRGVPQDFAVGFCYFDLTKLCLIVFVLLDNPFSNDTKM